MKALKHFPAGSVYWDVAMLGITEMRAPDSIAGLRLYAASLPRRSYGRNVIFEKLKEIE
jgi:hypothetical protein